MIAYIASCPSCTRDCWWYSYPSINIQDNNPRAILRIACRYCEVRDREAAAARFVQQQTGRRRMTVAT